MSYRVEFADQTDARDDLRRVPKHYQGPVRDELARLETEGPCIGLRLRGSGLDGFCRVAVNTRGSDAWRIVYRWPPDDARDRDLIEVYFIGTHSKRSGVYERLERYLDEQHVPVGEWSAVEQRLGCCDENGTMVELQESRVGALRAGSR